MAYKLDWTMVFVGSMLFIGFPLIAFIAGSY